MAEVNNNFCLWMELVATSIGGSTVKKQWVRTDDCQTRDCWRQNYKDKNLFFSAACFCSPEKSAKCTAPLYFVLWESGLENIRQSAIEICFYISENFNIPDDCIEVIYNGSGSVNLGRDDDNADQDGNNHYTNGGTGNGSRKGATEGSVSEMIILILPVVFNGRPLPFMQALNYRLSRQLAKDGIKNINTDVYEKEHFLPLPNSINSDTGRFIIPLQLKELMYLDAHNIAKLAKQPRAEDSMIMPQKMPEAVEWFNEVYEEEEKQQQRQKQLQELVLKQGWQIPPCIRRLTWMDLSKEQAFEVCRIISQLYSWIKASPDEIWHHFQQLDYRNHIGDYKKQKAIITFALENPGFVGCQHPLLEQFCPSGKCFIAELMAECESPYLFQEM